MNPMAPIAVLQSTDLVRRRVEGAGPGGRAATRPGAGAAVGVDLVPAAPHLRAPALLAAVVSAVRGRLAVQSASDQCSTVATPRKPARA
jgi:hypothetical protein